MPPPLVHTSPLQRMLSVLALNTAIAIGLTVTGPHGLWTNLVHSQCVGLSIWALAHLGMRQFVSDWSRHWRRMALITPVSAGLGLVFGMAVADTLGGDSPLAFWSERPARSAALLALSLGATALATFVFASREQAARTRQRQAELQSEAAQARLALLQSQLEPHMLFNTLANLRALIALDPPRAQAMLDDLIDWLRATLGASRTLQHPLADEFARLRDYLSLMAVRMGPRLHWQLDLPSELAQRPVPALLLQPLVENSLVHGLEPSVAGGELRVRARSTGARLVLEVEDTGVGLPASPPLRAQGGFGLAQVRERLQTLHGEDARLELMPRAGGGTLARIELPTEP